MLGQPVKQREDLIPGLALGGEMPNIRCAPKALHGHDSMRHVVEHPARRGRIGARHRQGQLLGKIVPEWQVIIPGIGRNLQQGLRITLGHARSGIEPGQ